ncbi:MAG: hypothetical protein ACLFSL_04740 [Candidatus Woesearchaeota archaeon]
MEKKHFRWTLYILIIVGVSSLGMNAMAEYYPDYTYRDHACDAVNLEDAYGIHSYEPLDRFWRTASNCCGPAKIRFPHLDTDPDKFSDANYILDPSERGVACWNNKGILDGSTVNYVSDGTYDDPQGVSPYNMLRLNSSDSLFEVNGRQLEHWDYHIYADRGWGDDVEESKLAEVFENNQINLPYFEGLDAFDNFDKLSVQSKNAFYLDEGMPHLLIVEMGSGTAEFIKNNSEHDGDFTLVRADADNPYGDPIDIELSNPLPSYLEDEVDEALFTSAFPSNAHFSEIVVKESGYYKLNMTIENPQENDLITINTITLVPRPYVLSDDGELLACKAKDGDEHLFQVESSLDGESLFPEEKHISHCEESRAGHVCSPEGYWISAEDPDAPSDRTGLSTSPNLIEDSGLDNGGPFNFSGCNLLDTGYLTCDTGDSGDVLELEDPAHPDRRLDHGQGYIFSARVNGYATIEFLDENDEEHDSIEVDSGDWKRINISGYATDDGVVRINFSGERFEIDDVQLEEKSGGQYEMGNYFETNTARGCCPEDACWNGEECIYSHGERQNKLFTNVDFQTHDGEKGYVCVGQEGNFKFLEKSYRWTHMTPYDYDDKTRDRLVRESDLDNFLEDPETDNRVHNPEFGFCPEDDCFIGENRSSMEHDIQGSNIDRTDCVPGADSMADATLENEKYGKTCVQGEWQTKTPYVANMLLDLAGGQDYSLYCGDYINTLNYAEYDFMGEGENVDILGQTISQLIVSTDEQIIPVRYADKACVLKYGTGVDNTIVAVPLNMHAMGTGADPGENIPSDYQEDGEVDIAPALSYFGLQHGGDCHDVERDRDEFISCDHGTFYNPRHNVVLYAHNTRLNNQIADYEFEDAITASTDVHDKIDEISEEIMEDDTYPDDNPERIRALQNHTRYDEIFIHMSDSKEMVVSREKMLDMRELENDLKYFLLIYAEEFELDQEFMDDYDIEMSPVNASREPEFADVFDYSAPGMPAVLKTSEGTYALSVSDYPESEWFRHWYKFTGRLRGELQLPPTE